MQIEGGAHVETRNDWRAAGFAAALTVELRKACSSRVLIGVTVILVAGLLLLSAGMLLAAATGEAQIVAKLGPLAEVGGWSALVGVSAQILAAGGMLAFGVALSWSFGREFADGTITGLFALPVRRSTIAIAKLIVYAGWLVLVAGVLTAGVALLGTIGGLWSSDPDAARQLLRLPVLAVLTGLVATPTAWIATLGRGLLPGIATVVVLLVAAQVCAVFGIGPWVPLVAPALWAIDPDAITPWQLAGSLVVPALFGWATAFSWSRMQLDR